jgi:hypothetical protein
LWQPLVILAKLRVATLHRDALTLMLPPGGPAEIDLVGAGQSTRRRAARAADGRTGKRVAGKRAAHGTGARADRTAADRTIFRCCAAGSERQGGKRQSDT